MRQHHVVALLLLMVSSPVGAKLSPAATAAVRAYRSSLERLEQRRTGATVAVVFGRALALDEPLIRPVRKEDSIEDLSEAEFEQLRTALRGMLVNREEIVYVRPDPQFFLRLAKQHGKADDVAQTDYSGCINFASGQLVARYRAWSAFRRRFPRSYVAQTAERLRDIEQDVADGTCACGNRDSVLQELRSFETLFPDSPVHAHVRQRVRDVEEGKSSVRMNCVSG